MYIELVHKEGDEISFYIRLAVKSTVSFKKNLVNLFSDRFLHLKK